MCYARPPVEQNFAFGFDEDPPGGAGFSASWNSADEAIVVTTPEIAAVRDADRIIGLLEARRDEIEQYRLVVNRYRPNMVQSNDMMSVDDVLDILSVELLGIVPEDEEIIVSTNKGEPVSGTDNIRSGLAFRNIARRLRGEDVPLMDFEALNQTWVNRLVKFFSPSQV